MRLNLIIPIVVVVLLGLLGSVYVVREGQVGLVLNLGRVARTDIGPGLHFKIPLVESARVFDRRFQANEFPPERSLTSERKDVSVDFVAIGFIVDAGDFYRATGGNEVLVTDRLAPIIKESLRNEINTQTLTELVSGNRSEVIERLLPGINQGARTLGMYIVDIRFKQIDLPTDSDVIDQVYNRMRAERQQVASALRAEGEEQARIVRAEADREQTVLLAEAERDAQKLRGEGDAEATRLYGQAANRDPAFFAFQRSLEAYRRSFNDGDAVIVLERDDPFLQYLRSDR
ncbi:MULTISPECIES: protease modulator HflC [unclassified Luteimonas]|uniref:protease modulator HflC n=1 Tax=unclassified Luteimonas TaxID=2629088 RepID=UPI0018F09FAB|nr:MULTISPECIES: protease modulator HflC [unclassified Luteimonas]MBJ6982743.1 protease modulator HflC [Luteimonas sp. MC1572]MBJ7574675.1 protease modulator HflC [Luteimonas sp. MC1828]QQO03980.1 protease modulator HflC [Luteimonas sp. MC1572]